MSERRSSRISNTIRIWRPKLEESLFNILFGPEYLRRLFNAFHNSQKLKRRGKFYDSLESSKDYLMEELRTGIIFFSTWTQFYSGTEDDPCLYHFFRLPNGEGKRHGLIKVPTGTETLSRVNGSLYIHYRVIMGCLDLESFYNKTTCIDIKDETEVSPGTEFSLAPFATYKFINTGAVNCLMYWTE